jgi:hypothetical protein
MAATLTAPTPRPHPVLHRTGRRSRQRTLFRRCGRAIPAIASLCRSGSYVRSRSRTNFDRHRAAVVDCECACQGRGAGKACLQIHYRQPGFRDPAWRIPLCAGCHARVHRFGAVRRWPPERLVELWAEQHPGVPLPLQFPAVPETVGAA